MKSELQQRAERAAAEFTKEARKPIVIEFAGVPKAGKSSTLAQVQAFFRRCGFRTKIVVERASVCPIRDKKHVHFNIWTVCTTLSQILDKTQDPPITGDPDILFLDRGLFDSICWMTMMEKLGRLRRSDRKKVEKFIRIDDWRKKTSAVIVMLVSPEDALKREQGHLPVVFAESSIMNEPVLMSIRQTNVECAERLKEDFRIYTVDTSAGETKNNPKRTAEKVAEMILSLVEEQIEEEILTLPKEQIRNIFKDDSFLLEKDAQKLSDLFTEDGTFISRNKVEDNKELVQALPVVIVRNASGSVLRLKRKEKIKENPLHGEMVIWAGGHVRKEDSANGDPLKQCAIRELEEELRLNVESDDLHLAGAIYNELAKGTTKHVAIAYEWFAKSDDIAIALSSEEFFERRGQSVSGSFIELNDLFKDVDDGKIKEPWSYELVHGILAKDSFKPLQMHLDDSLEDEPKD